MGRLGLILVVGVLIVLVGMSVYFAVADRPAPIRQIEKTLPVSGPAS